MKKLLAIILVLILCGCQTHTAKDFSSTEPVQDDSSIVEEEETDQETDAEEEKTGQEINEELADYYDTYYQEEIVYVNEDDYAKEEDYRFAGLKYVIKKTSFTFETDLIYTGVTYVPQEITDDDRDIVIFVTHKYEVYADGEAIGVTIMIDDNHLYIANDAKYHDGYTYVARMITKAERDRQKEEAEAAEENE